MRKESNAQNERLICIHDDKKNYATGYFTYCNLGRFNILTKIKNTGNADKY